MDPALAGLIRSHFADLAELARIAQNDLQVLWSRLNSSDPVKVRDALAEVLSQLAATYGSAAATLGADWYEEVRDALGVKGRFTADTAELPDDGRFEALAGWATGPLFSNEPDRAAVLSRAAGGFQRIVADADRHSVMQSSIADPKATGWQRVTSGGGCAFCEMLSGRGFVYESATVRFASHDHCDCTAAPAFEGRSVAVRPYTPSLRGSSEADRARVRKWIAANV